jgi:uncharacterized protein
LTATVTVRGNAVVPAQPDEVALKLELTYVAKTTSEALAEVARRSESLETLFNELGIESRQWTTSGVSVREEYDWNRQTGEQKLRGYAADNRISLRLNEPNLIGRLMHEATQRSQARIAGPYWRIAHDNPARVEACRQAAADARRKAEGYVAALGARLGAIVAISEPGIEPIPQPRDGRMTKMALAATQESAPEVTVQAGELDVAASVNVTFAIEQT